jgi:pullulanase/glycogen debranching enzyme
MMSYVSCHDDMCLVDRLKTSKMGIRTDELIRLDLLAQTAVFTSQGIPFMLSGEELLRDKKGVHNSFESPDSVTAWNGQTSSDIRRSSSIINDSSPCVSITLPSDWALPTLSVSTWSS